MHPPSSFGVMDHCHFEELVLKQGSWTRCQSCAKQQGLPTGRDRKQHMKGLLQHEDPEDSDDDEELRALKDELLSMPCLALEPGEDPFPALDVSEPAGLFPKGDELLCGVSAEVDEPLAVSGCHNCQCKGNQP